LWVYEGLTKYWGYVLAARSGLWTKAQTLELIALQAAVYDHVPGRQWKALRDTSNDPIVAGHRPRPWSSWQRDEDYYVEGALLWLDVDTLIRERSGGKRSLDDFAQAFFGDHRGSYSELTYTFDDVVMGLNSVESFDWATLLRSRLDGHGPGAPLGGLTRGGYKLVYTDRPSEFQKQVTVLRKEDDFSFSLGFSLDQTGTVKSVLWNGPAFKAGMTVGCKLVAVNEVTYDIDRLKDVVTAARRSAAPIELLVRSGDHYHSVQIDYHDGLRYPHLEKVGVGVASLDAILAPRS
jgi:predicted metalloprotease with PDZ domain